MKSLSLAAVCMIIVMTSLAQTTFTIKGRINGLNKGFARLSYIQNQRTRQVSAEIKNGHFVFSGSLTEPEFLQISFITENGNREIGFFAGNDQIVMLLDTANWNSPEITGSSSQKDYESYRQMTKSVDEKSNTLNKTGSALYVSGKLDEKTRDSLFRVHDQLDLERRMIIAAFAKDHPASPVSAWVINIYYGYEPNVAELLPVYHSLSKSNQQSLYGKQIAEIISSAEKTAIGFTAPDFMVSDPSGKQISLHGYRGKYVLVDFWASWCGPCRAENPNVVKAYGKYHSDKFDILGVSLDNNKEQWLKAIQKDNLLWKQGSDLKAWNSQIVKDYGIKGIPFNMLLDPGGKIVAKNLRGADLQKILNELFERENPGYIGLK
jgi:thiol-disulfide isomerase/thioredoxin